MSKSIESMSAEELFELARQKEEQERQAKQEAKKAEVDALRQKRRDLKARHKKELDAIDQQIKALSGQARGGRRGGGRGGKRSGVSSMVVDLVKQYGPIKTQDLREKLEAKGVDTGNLGQTLAYLKKRGALKTPERAVYEAA